MPIGGAGGRGLWLGISGLSVGLWVLPRNDRTAAGLIMLAMPGPRRRLRAVVLRGPSLARPDQRTPWRT